MTATDDKQWTPLHLASRAGNASKVKALLEAGAAPSAANSQGNTPLHLVSRAPRGEGVVGGCDGVCVCVVVCE